MSTKYDEIKRILHDHEKRLKALESKLKQVDKKDVDKKEEEPKVEHKPCANAKLTRNDNEENGNDNEKKKKKDKKKEPITRDLIPPIQTSNQQAPAQVDLNSLQWQDSEQPIEEEPEPVLEAPPQSKVQIIEEELKFLTHKFEKLNEFFHIHFEPGAEIYLEGVPTNGNSYFTCMAPRYINLAQSALQGERKAWEEKDNHLTEMLFYFNTILNDYKLLLETSVGKNNTEQRKRAIYDYS
jgi:hypothetical protein